MKRFIYLFLLLLVLFWTETALKKVFVGSFGVPQFVILFITAFAVSRDLKEVLYWSFIAGFLGELFSSLYFGTFIFMCVTAAVIAYFITRNVTAQDISFSTVLIVVSLQVALLPFFAWIFNALAGGLGLTAHPPLKEFFSLQLGIRLLMNLIFFFPINRLFRILFDESR